MMTFYLDEKYMTVQSPELMQRHRREKAKAGRATESMNVVGTASGGICFQICLLSRGRMLEKPNFDI